MLIGNFPIADRVDPEDVIIISKDGVHLEQITAELAGLGGTGLRWWKETETEIYREYTVENLGAPVPKTLRVANQSGTGYDEVPGYEWHGRYFEKDDFEAHAAFPAKDVNNNQPWIWFYDPLTMEATHPDKPMFNTFDLLPEEHDDTVFDPDDINVIQKATVTWYQGYLSDMGYSTGDTGTHPTSAYVRYSKAFPRAYIGIGTLRTWTIPNSQFYQMGAVIAPNNGVGDISADCRGGHKQAGACVSSGTYGYFNEFPESGIPTDIADLVAEHDGEVTYDSSAENTAYYFVSGESIDPFSGGDYYNVPHMFIATCVGYDPDYKEEGVISDDPTQETAHPGQNFPKITQGGGRVQQFVDRDIITNNVKPDFTDMYRAMHSPDHNGGKDTIGCWSGLPYFSTGAVYEDWYGYEGEGSTLKSNSAKEKAAEYPVINRPDSIVIDYKDPEGYVWDVLIFPISYTYYNSVTPAVDGGSYGSSAPYKHFDFSDEQVFQLDRGVKINNRNVGMVGNWFDDYTSQLYHFAYTNDPNTYSMKVPIKFVIRKVRFREYTGDIASPVIIHVETVGSPDYYTYMDNVAQDPTHWTMLGTDHHLYLSYYYTSTPNSKFGDYYLRNARDIAANLINGLGISGFKPAESDTSIVRTNIGVEENMGYRTGYSYHDYEGNEKFKEMASIDPYKGTGYFKGALYENGKPISNSYQKKLVPGDNITINGNVISAGIELDPSEFVRNNFVSGTGIDITVNQNQKIQFDMDFELTGGTASGTLVPCAVSPVTASDNKVKYKVQVDKDELDIPVLVAGHGVSINRPSPVSPQQYISSTALDKVKVNGQEQSIQVDPTSNDRYVDLTIESGGGGQTVDIYKPIPDYANRSSIITTFSVKNDTYTAPADGVLYLRCRTTSTVFAQVGVTKSGATGETGPVYSLGNGKTGDISDAANMIPMQKGNVAKLQGQNPQNISTSESGNGGKFYFIPYVKRDDSETDWVSGDVNFTTATTSIAGYQMANSDSDTYDSSVSYYTFTPTVDGVLVPSNGNPNTGAGKFRIFPMENGEAVDCYYMRSVNNGQAPFEMFPLKKGQTYKFARSSSDVGGNLYFYPFTTKQTDDIYTPFLDLDAAETISLSASTSTWSVITSPAVTDRPGILIDRINSSSNETLGIMVKTSDGNWELTHNSSTSSKQFIQVPAYDSYNWRYRGASGSVIFAPFKKLVNPGIDFAVENGHNLVTNKTLDLSALYDRIAALEAAVFPTT